MALGLLIPRVIGAEKKVNSIAALVVARAGSKSLPRKNIKELAGKPLIFYTFEAAKKSQGLERVFLSTDSQEIADFGKKSGIEVPFMRPEALAGDKSHVIDATLHATDWILEHLGYRPAYWMLLQPTSPFRTVEDIQTAINLALKFDANAVVSVCPAAHHPHLMMKIGPGQQLQPWSDQAATTRRQDLPPVYVLNGAIYLVKDAVLRAEKTWFPKGALACIMPEERSLDIDTPLDFHVAQLLMRHPFAAAGGGHP